MHPLEVPRWSLKPREQQANFIRALQFNLPSVLFVGFNFGKYLEAVGTFLSNLSAHKRLLNINSVLQMRSYPFLTRKYLYGACALLKDYVASLFHYKAIVGKWGISSNSSVVASGLEHLHAGKLVALCYVRAKEMVILGSHPAICHFCSTYNFSVKLQIYCTV